MCDVVVVTVREYKCNKYLCPLGFCSACVCSHCDVRTVSAHAVNVYVTCRYTTSYTIMFNEVLVLAAYVLHGRVCVQKLLVNE